MIQPTEIKNALQNRGRLLRALRLRTGFSVYKAAQKSGLSRQTIIAMEKGRNHSAESYLIYILTIRGDKK